MFNIVLITALIITVTLLTTRIYLWWFYRKSAQQLQDLIDNKVKPNRIEQTTEYHIKDMYKAWKIITKNEKEDLTDEDEIFFAYFCEQYDEDKI